MILDYMRQFTEKVVLSTRAGEIERENILKELQQLLADKPEKAPDGVIEYLHFLIAVVKGENVEEATIEALSPQFKTIFGEVIQKFKGTDIKKNIKDITKQAIIASRDTDQSKTIAINEIEAVLQSQPKSGSENVVIYLEFLMALIKGDDCSGFMPKLEGGLIHMDNEVLQEVIKPDMLSFFEKLTTEAFNAHNFENGVETFKAKMAEMLDTSETPPVDIANYLNLLLAVVDGKETAEMEKTIVAEFMEIFNSCKDEI